MSGQAIHPMIEEARDFANTVLRPRAGEFDQQEAVSRDVIDAMAEKGFLGSILPAEFGGTGMDALSYGYLTEEIGKGCSSTRALLTVHTSLVGETLAKLGTQAQKEKWLPLMATGEKLACFALSEPDIGTDATSVKTSYQKEGDVYVLNGKKKWITYSAIADMFLVFASCDGEVSAFIVERGMKGLSTQPMSGLMASRGAHLAEISFDNMEVPVANLVGKPGMGFSFVANTALFYGRYSIAWAGVAIAAAAVEEMVTYARSREQFGKKIGQHQLIQGIVADAVTGLHVGRGLCEKIGILRDSGDDQAVMETNIAKYYTSKMVMDVTTQTIQVFGGNGCWNRYPVERLFREAKVLEIIEGSSQVQQIMISNFGMRRYFRKASKAMPK